ncbi:hypothetical protein QFZ24_004040 [Streptomyces phaeochromogenes]|nr:hypothetical protein [Streptomyces phaeochromogenes]
MACSWRIGSTPGPYQRRLPCEAKRAVADRRCRQAMALRGRSRVPQPPIRRVLNAMRSIRIAYDGEAGSA